MAHRIEIFSRISDARAEVRKHKIARMRLKGKLEDLKLTDIYTVSKDLDSEQLKKCGEILTNPVSQGFCIGPYVPNEKFDWAVEIGFLPGVTDNVGHTARESIEDLLKIKFDNGEKVYTSQCIFLKGKLSEAEVKEIAENLKDVQQWPQIKNYEQFCKEKGMSIIVPEVHLKAHPQVDEINLNVSDEELAVLGKAGIADVDGEGKVTGRRGPLALDLRYIKAIQKYFKEKGRNPTDIELESIAQTWSEHCKHTIFAAELDEIKDGLFKHYIQGATEEIRRKKRAKGKDFCFSVFEDNSGAIVFDDKWLITDKVETHNSPSAIGPVGGAVTGIVGVNRDAIGFGLGAKPIINRYGFCFGYPEDTELIYRGKDRKNPALLPIRIMLGVIEGVNIGGNCSGIPTPQGFVYFNDRYKGKPLVFVGTLGLIPKEVNGRKMYEKRAQPGDIIVMIGGRVGVDGIHGATFSSEALDSGSPATAVQIGDPITQKKLSDAVVKEARDLELYSSITDNGAGGLSCSVAEMAKECGGCHVDLEKVPLKYPNLAPWEIWVSEAQERMTVAVPQKKLSQFLELMERRGVEATVIGKFNDSGKCTVSYNGKMVMDVGLDFLHDGLPKRELKSEVLEGYTLKDAFVQEANLTSTLREMLSRHNVCSFEFISAQYDHEVQGGSVIKPLQGKGRVNANATVMRPVLDSMKGVAISHGLNPPYGDVDMYNMAACSIDTAIRNIIAVGGRLEKIALLDNFCWCSSNDPKRLAQLKEAVKACYDYAIEYETPFISGKDSMFNDFKGYDTNNNPLLISIPPTLLVSSLAVIDDVEKCITMDVKFPGDLVYILGETKNEVSSSEYFAMMSERNGKEYTEENIPTVDAKSAIKLYKALNKAIERGTVASAHALSVGGLGIGLAKVAIAGQLGVEVDLSKVPKQSDLDDDYILFSESQSRFIVTVAPDMKKKFETIMEGQRFARIGKVQEKGKGLIIKNANRLVLDFDIDEMTESYKKTLREY
jgi:phosphoribosylformylglycinamidine synthase